MYHGESARGGITEPTRIGYTWPRSVTNRSRDWFAQAERDLEQARASQVEARHEWACFAAQQAAEMAVKALHLSLGQEAWGHVVARLLSELPFSAGDLVEGQGSGQRLRGHQVRQASAGAAAIGIFRFVRPPATGVSEATSTWWR